VGRETLDGSRPLAGWLCTGSACQPAAFRSGERLLARMAIGTLGCSSEWLGPRRRFLSLTKINVTDSATLPTFFGGTWSVIPRASDRGARCATGFAPSGYCDGSARREAFSHIQQAQLGCATSEDRLIRMNVGLETWALSRGYQSERRDGDCKE
jgi:hypothetical protein